MIRVTNLNSTPLLHVKMGMNSPVCSLSWIKIVLAAIAVGLIGAVAVVPSPGAAAEASSRGGPRVSLPTARERAELAHVIYATTMDVIHHHYFRKGQAVLPARAMEEVFAEVAEKSKVEGSWIAVNTRAMSINHEPKTAFEKQAADAIAAGQERFELVEKGYFRSARAIPLTEGCVSCHDGFFRGPAKSPRYAGLIISVPIK